MVLVDNTVLSNFALVHKIQLLTTALAGEATTTSQVIEEFRAGIANGRLPETKIDWLGVIELDAEESSYFQRLLSRLNAGEAACLAIAAKRNAQLLTDDRDARKLAAQLKVPVSGTIGILLRLVQIDVLTYDDANEILRLMIDKGYRSPVQKLEDL